MLYDMLYALKVTKETIRSLGEIVVLLLLYIKRGSKHLFFLYQCFDYTTC